MLKRIWGAVRALSFVTLCLSPLCVSLAHACTHLHTCTCLALMILFSFQENIVFRDGYRYYTRYVAGQEYGLRCRQLNFGAEQVYLNINEIAAEFDPCKLFFSGQEKMPVLLVLSWFILSDADEVVAGRARPFCTCFFVCGFGLSLRLTRFICRSQCTCFSVSLCPSRLACPAFSPVRLLCWNPHVCFLLVREPCGYYRFRSFCCDLHFR